MWQCLIQRCEAASGRVHPTDAIHLYVLVVRYTYDSSVQALDSRRARRTTRAVNGPKSQHVVVSLLSKVLWVGRTLLVRNGDPKKSGFSLARFVPPCIARHRPSCRRETQPKTASAGKQQLVDHNSTIETQISDRASCNFLLWWLQLICVGSRNSTSSRRRAPCTTSTK